MTPFSFRPATIAFAALALSTACLAESGASSASSAGSASVGSLSNSLTASSNSSSPADQVAAGDYRVVEVATLDDRPGMLRLQLQPVATAAPGAGLWLTLPARALAARPLRAGDTVHARHRAYGVEFAHAVEGDRPASAFFLVLADSWFDELAPKAL